MRIPRRHRVRRILGALLVILFLVKAVLALVETQMGTLAGLLLLAGICVVCFRAGRRRAQAQAAQAQAAQAQAAQAQAAAPRSQAPRSQAPRPTGRRRSPLGARMVRDAARLFLARR